jgi:catechol 2,3-dioxygenase-like lactoylglutathione lyase family enzyme
MPSLQTASRSSSDAEVDNRPRFGIGHLSMPADDVARLTDFYTTIGMRLVVNMGRASILELRGGTHLIIRSGTPGTGSLDLIVDDIDETRAVLDAAGADPSSIERGSPHDRFTATDPEGNVLVVNSNHAIGPV